MDFALLLVVLTAVAGVVALVDVLLWRRERVAAATSGLEVSEPLIVEYARSFFPILLVVLVVRSFLFEPFRIPSGSMLPTLEQGDFIFVNKFAYGLRLPVLNTKIVQIGEPQHGDVVVFRLPSDPSINYIKRVVGLPGDVIVYDRETRHMTINGKPIAMDVTGTYGADADIELAHERLGAHDHDILLMRREPSRGGTYEVPAGHYFVMGDNRDNSQDSRFEAVEYVPEENLVGRAVGIWMNWRWPAEGGPQWSRIGKDHRMSAASRGRQRGITVLGFLILAVLFGVIGLAGIKVTPMYIKNMRLGAVLTDMQHEMSGKGATPQSIRYDLAKRFSVEDINLPNDAIKINPNTSGFSVRITYENRAPYVADIYLVVMFDKQVEIRR